MLQFAADKRIIQMLQLNSEEEDYEKYYDKNSFETCC